MYIYMYVCIDIYIYIYIYIIYIYIYINAPPWGLSSLAKELTATVSVMQGSSKELSSLVVDRVSKKSKQRLLLLFAKHKIPKNSLSQRSPLVAVWSEALVYR